MVSSFGGRRVPLRLPLHLLILATRQDHLEFRYFGSIPAARSFLFIFTRISSLAESAICRRFLGRGTVQTYRFAQVPSCPSTVPGTGCPYSCPEVIFLCGEPEGVRSRSVLLPFIGFRSSRLRVRWLPRWRVFLFCRLRQLQFANKCAWTGPDGFGKQF